MKRILFLLIAIIAWAAVSAQTIQIFKDGELVASYDETNMDEVTFSAQSVTVMSASSTVVYDEKDIDEIQYKTTSATAPVSSYVDLGLSVQWATCNVGASLPEEIGDYYAWGETLTKKTYNWGNYFDYVSTTRSFKKYTNERGKKVLDPTDDVAHVKLGGYWRMPTDEECIELLHNCTWTATQQNGMRGFLVTGPNGNSIFLPAAGGSFPDNEDGGCGSYWSRSLDKSSSDAWSFSFDALTGMIYKGNCNRCVGNAVRPVYVAPKSKPGVDVDGDDFGEDEDWNQPDPKPSEDVDIDGDDFGEDESWDQPDPKPTEDVDVDGEDFEEDEDWNQPDPEPTEEVDVEGGDYDEDEDWDE